MSVEEAARTLALPLQDPYVGLAHFPEEYADFFFGRETEISLVIGNLRAARLTLLYAQSGVGKSSMLRAGVVARMREVADRDHATRGSPRLIPVVFSSWSERPVAALIGALEAAVRPYLSDGLSLPEDDLEAALEEASAALDATVLVILDQFEEYFLYPDEAPEEERIAVQLARCVNRSDLRTNFLISIREDAYAELGDLFRGKVKNVYGNFLHLDFLDRAGAREAVERPVERVNELQPDSEPHTVEPELVAEVLDQVGRDEADERIETTYLQLVMRRLWEEEDRAGSRVLRLETLQRLGGAQAIIGNHLDRAMEGNGGAGLSQEQRRVAAAVFRFLVTSGGTKIALTATDLADLSGFPLGEIGPVLRHLSSPRLHILRPVVFEEGESEPRYEIFHDALADPIRQWRARIEEDEREERRERERAEKEEAQRAAAEAERQAERERQRRRLAQALLALAVLALLVGATVFALANQRRADRREAEGESVRVAERISELTQVPSFGPALAAVAGVEAARLAPTDEARERALAQLQLSPALPTVMAGHTDGVQSVAFWPGLDKVVTGGDRTVRYWNEYGEEDAPSPLQAKGNVVAVAVSKPLGQGAQLIAAGLDSSGIQYWELDSAESRAAMSKTLPGGGGETKGIAFNPRFPGMLAAGGDNGTVVLWDLTRPGRDPRRFGTRRVGGEVEDLAFAPDGRSLFVAGSAGGFKLGISEAGFTSGPVAEAEEASAVAAGPEGSYAFGGKGGIELRRAGGTAAQLRLPGEVYGLAFADGGRVLVSGGSDWNVTTWDLQTLRPFGPARAANRAAVNDVAVSAGGAIAAAGADRLVKLWAPQPSRTLAGIVGGLDPREADRSLPKIYDLVLGAKGQIATPVGRDGTLIWGLPKLSQTDSVQRPVARIPGRSQDAAFHGNILVAGRERSFAVWRTGSACPGGRCRLVAPDKENVAGSDSSFVFAPSGEQLLLASIGGEKGGGVLRLWDLTDVARTHRVELEGETPLGSSEVMDLSLNPEHPLVAVATGTAGLRVLDVSEPADPRAADVTPSRTRGVYAVSFSPDGSFLASGGESRQVDLWRVSEQDSGRFEVFSEGGTLLQREAITALAFSPDGEVLAVADAGGNICFYATNDLHLIGDRSCLRGYNTQSLAGVGGIEAMRFTRLPGGEPVLLTAGRGQPVIAWSSLLWNLSDDERVDEAVMEGACAISGRSLQSPEWELVFGASSFAGHPSETCPAG